MRPIGTTAPRRGTTIAAPMRHTPIVLLTLIAALIAPAAALADGPPPGSTAKRAGVQTLKYRIGPIPITPGQNDNVVIPNDKKPTVDGWIVGFRPNLTRKGGAIPRVDDIHLHHGVWVVNGRPVYAAGEEKTQLYSPEGFGWRHRTTDGWLMNHMIHNLTPTPTEVYITYELDFIPNGSPAAAGLREVRTQWLDVMGFDAYPVFDVHKGAGGRDKRFTYPTEDAKARTTRRNRWVVEEDGALVGTAGHLHPGGLHTEMFLTRAGRTTRLFRSEAKYWEPAGPVSWDMAMSTAPANWRVGVKAGDEVWITATYDTARASWYESMGIMPTIFSPGAAGPDPFETDVDVPGKVTHGALRENRNHGGDPLGLPDPRRLLSTPPPPKRTVGIRDFLYGRGDLNAIGRSGRPPTVKPGQTLRFVNRDAKDNVMHSITSCKAPCNKSTGIAYPLADGPVRFDSGNLGFGPAGFTAAANRDSWKTPRTLKAGTYTYFCRVHPFMRGAFRVAR